MKKKMKILLSLALFAASSVFMACGSTSVNNSSNSIKLSSPTPAPVGAPAQSDLPEKLKGIGVSDTAASSGKKSNVTILTEKINAYKEAYKNNPAQADKEFNVALKSFADNDVKDNLLPIKDLAFSEVVKAPAVNNSDVAPQKEELGKIVGERISPLAKKLDDIDQKVGNNDLSRIMFAFLIQTLILGVIISVNFFWQFFSMRQLKSPEIDAPPNSQTRAPSRAGKTYPAAGGAAQINPVPEAPVVDLSKIEGNVAAIINSVDELAQRMIAHETIISKKIDDYWLKLSNRPTDELRGNEPRGNEQTGASRSFTPNSVRELKDKYQGLYRHLDKENFTDLLVLSHNEGTFLLTESQKGGEISYYIFPNKERFRNGDEYRNIEYYFDCDSAGAGELLVEKPARVRNVGERWELQNKGKISIQ